MTVIERLERMERIVDRLKTELGIDIETLAGDDLASQVTIEPEPLLAEPLDIGEPLDLDAVDLAHVTETCGNGSAYDEIPYPDIETAIHDEAVKRGFVDPESLAVVLSNEHWSPEDLEFDIKQRLTDQGYEVLDETSIYVVPDFGALLDEVQDLRNLSPDAIPAYREYAKAELQRRRDAGRKYKAPYQRRVKPPIDWNKVNTEPVLARVAL